MAFKALSFVVPFFSYYVLYNLSYHVNLSYQVVHGIVRKMKIMHIFGLILPNWLKLCDVISQII